MSEKPRGTFEGPCKSYATEAAAERATKKVALACAKHIHCDENARSARYVVFFNEAWGRWVGAIDISEVLSRQNTGGYVGVASSHGFYSY